MKPVHHLERMKIVAQARHYPIQIPDDLSMSELKSRDTPSELGLEAIEASPSQTLFRDRQRFSE